MFLLLRAFFNHVRSNVSRIDDGGNNNNNNETAGTSNTTTSGNIGNNHRKTVPVFRIKNITIFTDMYVCMYECMVYL